MTAFLVSAIALSLERMFYVWVWRQPQQFQNFCRLAGRGSPVDVLGFCFALYKILQACVFLAWCWPLSEHFQARVDALSFVTGVLLLLAGQVLNLAVFHRLGRTGVFYGVRFGHAVPWCTQFPFSLLNHPQYVGTLMSIWGFFLIARFPQFDWFVLPALETAYYVAGAYFES